MNRISRGAVVGAILIPLVTAGFIAQENGTRDGARLFGQVLDLVGTRFVDTVAAADLYEKAARGLVEQLQDPYSELLSPKQLAMFNTTTGGRYGGLGMRIEEQKGKGVTIAQVFPHTPAERSGIREGDVIVEIDSVSALGWNTTRVSDVLKGPPGTKVNVSFARPGVTTPINVTFTRAIIKVPAVPYAILLDDSNIGYIPLQQFNESAHGDLAAGVKELQSQGATALVIDLRGNPGGYLEQALEISNLFLTQGQEIASVRGRAQPTQTYVAREQPLAPTIPLVVLTDRYSASASEIVAGALQDHDRAVVIGTTSFGKGLVQTLFNLDGGYALKMTTGKWFTPNGRSIQKERKLMPDGSYVEVHPDSLESDSARLARPKYKSDAGRVVYGGGAITPDVVVKSDTLTTGEQEFLKAIAPASQEYYVTLYDFAYEKKNQVRPDFVVTPEWRDDFYNRLVQKQVIADRALFDGASGYIDATLGGRIASLAFGDSTAKRRAVANDAPLLAAIDLLKRGQTQQELFALVRPASPE